ncbi:MAG: hypothetical protein R2706_08635 [Acidimicrobiales bacterium]
MAASSKIRRPGPRPRRSAVTFGRSIPGNAPQVTVHQGDDMGQPSRLTVSIPATGGIAVSGSAVPLP